MEELNVRLSAIKLWRQILLVRRQFKCNMDNHFVADRNPGAPTSVTADFFDVRKLGVPGYEELATGAVATAAAGPIVVAVLNCVA